MEDFITFEIAKKLKEKGFIGNGDIGCRCGFYTDADNYAYDDLDNSELLPNECLRFTISQALKWLREEKKIDVLPQRGHISIDKNSKVTRYYNVNIYFERSFACTLDNDEEDYSTYEQAVLAGIKYVLDNLI